MVSNIRLLQIHISLCKIFDCPESQSFTDLPILIVRNLFQLASIKAAKMFQPYNNAFGYVFNL